MNTNLLLFSFLNVLKLNFDCSILLFASAGNLGIQFELQTLFSEGSLEGLGNLKVNSNAPDIREKFDTGDFGPKPRPYGSLGKRRGEQTMRQVQKKNAIIVYISCVPQPII